MAPCARDEPVIETCLVAIALDVDNLAVVDDLLAVTDDVALDELPTLGLADTDFRLGPLSAPHVAIHPDPTALCESGAPLPIADELLFASLATRASSAPDVPPRTTAFEPRETGSILEGAGLDRPIAPQVQPNVAPGGCRPRTGWATLTGTERRVAELVSFGLTNREVGYQMFLPRHTVDAHLRHILVKLNITTRMQLERYARIWSMLSKP